MSLLPGVNIPFPDLGPLNVIRDGSEADSKTLMLKKMLLLKHLAKGKR